MYKELTELVEIVLKRDHLVLLLLGCLTFLTGAAGGWPTLGIKILDPAWQYAMGTIGVSLLIVGTLLVVRTQQNRAHVKLEGFRIAYPDTRSPVQVPFEMRGECKKIPKGIELWMVHVTGVGGSSRYWPYVAASIKGPEWVCRVNSISGKPGEYKKLSMFVVGKNGQALFNYFKSAGRENSGDGIQRWPGITELTDDVTECGSVEIIITS